MNPNGAGSSQPSVPSRRLPDGRPIGWSRTRTPWLPPSAAPRLSNVILDGEPSRPHLGGSAAATSLMSRRRTGGGGVFEGSGVTHFSDDRSLGAVVSKNQSADEVQKSAEDADGRRVVKNWK